MGDPSRPAALDAPLAIPPRKAPPVQQVAPPPVQQAAPPPAPQAPIPQPPPVAPKAVAPVPVSAPSPVAAAAPAVPAPAPAARVVPPSLVDAFAALLSAEERIGLTPSAAPASVPVTAAPIVTEELIETVTARVVARLTDQSRQTILDAAERLVREEIERIKANQ